MGCATPSVRRDGSRLGAFTLVELLVVIGIISLLIAILLPSLSRARQSAINVQCLSNLRQIGLGMVAYTADNKGYFPPLTVAWGYPYWEDRLENWFPRGAAQTVDWNGAPNTHNAIFFCPAEFTHHGSQIDYGIVYPTISYDLNNPSQPPVKIVQIQRPAERVMICDAVQDLGGGVAGGAWFVTTSIFDSLASVTSLTPWSPGIYPPRHSKAMNFLFVDGHAESTDVSPMTMTRFEELKRAFVK